MTTVCPNCGRAVSATSVICGNCLQSIHEFAVDDGAIERRAAASRRARRNYYLRRFAVVAFVVVATSAYAWFSWLKPDSLLPVPTSTARTLTSALDQPSRWASVGGDNFLHRATSATPKLDAPEVWRRTLDARITTQPVVGDTLVYVGVASAGLVALSRDDGREVWRVPVPGQLDAAPTLVGDRLYAVLRDGTIAAFDPQTGKTIWRSGDGPTFFASPLVSEGVVYAISLGRITALDAENGKTLWIHEIDTSVSSQAAPVANHEVLLAASFRRGLVFDRAHGSELFFYALPSPNHLMLAGDQAMLITEDRVVAFGLDQRRPWWEPFRTGWAELWLFGMAPAPPDQPRRWVGPADKGSFAPALAGDTLVIATATGLVRGLDMSTGRPRWEQKLGPIVAAPLVTPAGAVLVQPEGLLLIDPRTGEEHGRRPLPGASLRGMGLTSNGMFLISGDATVLALR